MSFLIIDRWRTSYRNVSKLCMNKIKNTKGFSGSFNIWELIWTLQFYILAISQSEIHVCYKFSIDFCNSFGDWGWGEVAFSNFNYSDCSTRMPRKIWLGVGYFELLFWYQISPMLLKMSCSLSCLIIGVINLLWFLKILYLDYLCNLFRIQFSPLKSFRYPSLGLLVKYITLY